MVFSSEKILYPDIQSECLGIRCSALGGLELVGYEIFIIWKDGIS